MAAFQERDHTGCGLGFTAVIGWTTSQPATSLKLKGIHPGGLGLPHCACTYKQKYAPVLGRSPPPPRAKPLAMSTPCRGLPVRIWSGIIQPSVNAFCDYYTVLLLLYSVVMYSSVASRTARAPAGKLR